MNKGVSSDPLVAGLKPEFWRVITVPMAALAVLFITGVATQPLSSLDGGLVHAIGYFACALPFLAVAYICTYSVSALSMTSVPSAIVCAYTLEFIGIYNVIERVSPLIGVFFMLAVGISLLWAIAILRQASVEQQSRQTPSSDPKPERESEQATTE